MNRRKLLRYFATLLPASTWLSASAQDDAFPSRPVRIIAGSGSGTLVDQAARVYADKMSAHLKQPVVVENVAGAASLLAIRQVLKAPADGYTILVAATTLVTLPYLNAKAGYAVRDFAPLGEMVRSPVILVASAASSFKSVADIVAAAKTDPGRISFGSSGVGTTNHLPVEMLAQHAGVSFTHVPYKGIAAAVPDVAAGRVSFLMAAATSVSELIRSGALRPLAISAGKRSPKFPDVPTLKELGYPDASFELWIGAVVAAGTPRAATARLADAMEAARNHPDVLARFEALGQEISAVRTPEQFETVLRADEQRLSKLIKAAGIAAE